MEARWAVRRRRAVRRREGRVVGVMVGVEVGGGGGVVIVVVIGGSVGGGLWGLGWEEGGGAGEG